MFPSHGGFCSREKPPYHPSTHTHTYRTAGWGSRRPAVQPGPAAARSDCGKALLFILSSLHGFTSDQEHVLRREERQETCFWGGKPSLSTEKNLISPVLQQGSVNPGRRTTVCCCWCLCPQISLAEKTPFKLMSRNSSGRLRLSDLNRQGDFMAWPLQRKMDRVFRPKKSLQGPGNEHPILIPNFFNHFWWTLCYDDPASLISVINLNINHCLMLHFNTFRDGWAVSKICSYIKQPHKLIRDLPPPTWTTGPISAASMGHLAVPPTILISSDHVRTVQKDFTKMPNVALNVPSVKKRERLLWVFTSPLRYQIYFLVLIGV